MKTAVERDRVLGTLEFQSRWARLLAIGLGEQLVGDLDSGIRQRCYELLNTALA